MAVSNTSNINNLLAKTTTELSKSFAKLSSGKRIVTASDDAAGLAVVSALEASSVVQNRAAQNAGDGLSIAEIAGGAIDSISQITSRQAELAEQSANGTLSDTQRQSLNDEFQALSQEKDRIFQTTQFNGVNVFNSQGTTLQVGDSSDSNSQINLPSVDTASLSPSLDISSQGGAKAAIDTLNTTIQNLGQAVGDLGAAVSRISISADRAKSSAIESESAASRIRDVDVAEETARTTALGIKQQVNAALAAQSANLSAGNIAQLLK